MTRYGLLLLLLTAPAMAADPGLYHLGDGLFLGTGTGFGTSDDILRDLGIPVEELTTITEIPWFQNPFEAIYSGGRNQGIWSYQNDPILPDLLVVGVDDDWAAYCLREWEWVDPCPVGTVESVGNWSTVDLDWRDVDHLSLFQATIPLNNRCEVPEPETWKLLVIAGGVILAGMFAYGVQS